MKIFQKGPDEIDSTTTIQRNRKGGGNGGGTNDGGTNDGGYIWVG